MASCLHLLAVVDISINVVAIVILAFCNVRVRLCSFGMAEVVGCLPGCPNGTFPPLSAHAQADADFQDHEWAYYTSVLARPFISVLRFRLSTKSTQKYIRKLKPMQIAALIRPTLLWRAAQDLTGGAVFYYKHHEVWRVHRHHRAWKCGNTFQTRSAAIVWPGSAGALEPRKF